MTNKFKSRVAVDQLERKTQPSRIAKEGKGPMLEDGDYEAVLNLIEEDELLHKPQV